MICSLHFEGKPPLSIEGMRRVATYESQARVKWDGVGRRAFVRRLVPCLSTHVAKARPTPLWGSNAPHAARKSRLMKRPRLAKAEAGAGKRRRNHSGRTAVWLAPFWTTPSVAPSHSEDSGLRLPCRAKALIARATSRNGDGLSEVHLGQSAGFGAPSGPSCRAGCLPGRGQIGSGARVRKGSEYAYVGVVAIRRRLGSRDAIVLAKPTAGGAPIGWCGGRPERPRCPAREQGRPRPVRTRRPGLRASFGANCGNRAGSRGFRSPAGTTSKCHPIRRPAGPVAGEAKGSNWSVLAAPCFERGHLSPEKPPPPKIETAGVFGALR
jgi:hypothetical protein